ncbi:MAG TPA: hypothetical protein PLZ08_12445 [Bacillota bacterium]|jgi:Flp pilus assembly pilin Flp|nr:hypothetical protein [Bacillota bacterium]HOL09819.1 hypothetical protein [Bacillota bacterium]HPO98749.1 hypothetical protein [Bacillota bacterium]
MSTIKLFYKSETAQGTIEYGFILCLVAISIIVALTFFASSLITSIETSASKIPQ